MLTIAAYPNFKLLSNNLINNHNMKFLFILYQRPIHQTHQKKFPSLSNDTSHTLLYDISIGYLDLWIALCLTSMSPKFKFAVLIFYTTHTQNTFLVILSLLYDSFFWYSLNFCLSFFYIFLYLFIQYSLFI